MNRRWFLRLVGAATVAATVGIESLRPSYPRVQERAWLWQEITAFKESATSDVKVAQMLAQRSDGVFFHQSIVIPGDVPTLFIEGHGNLFPERTLGVSVGQEDKIQNGVAFARSQMKLAELQLDTYRDCACQVGWTCPIHQQPTAISEVWEG